jgi:hypothetical protein
LLLSAALTGVIGLGIFGGALARPAVSDAGDHARRRALGADRRTLTALVMLRAGIVSTCVVIIAVVAEIAASAVFPVVAGSAPTSASAHHRWSRHRTPRRR